MKLEYYAGRLRSLATSTVDQYLLRIVDLGDGVSLGELPDSVSNTEPQSAYGMLRRTAVSDTRRYMKTQATMVRRASGAITWVEIASTFHYERGKAHLRQAVRDELFEIAKDLGTLDTGPEIESFSTNGQATKVSPDTQWWMRMAEISGAKRIPFAKDLRTPFTTPYRAIETDAPEEWCDQPVSFVTVVPGLIAEAARVVEKLMFTAPAQRKGADPLPKFLELEVDEAARTVKRAGFRPCLALEGAEWHTFIVAFKAKERGTTREEWTNGYPGDTSPESMKVCKSRVNEKLQVLGVRLKGGVPPRLEKTPQGNAPRNQR